MPYSGIARILSVDPGTNQMGVAITTLSFPGRLCTIDYVNTINIDRQHKDHHALDDHGGELTKQLVIRDVMLDLIQLYQPHVVVMESPYMGRFAQAFKLLTKCMHTSQLTTYGYDPDLPFVFYDPATIKQHIGVKGTSGDKNLMTEAIRSRMGSEIILDPHLFSLLDEHSVDAIAVGYAHAKVLCLGDV